MDGNPIVGENGQDEQPVLAEDDAHPLAHGDHGHVHPQGEQPHAPHFRYSTIVFSSFYSTGRASPPNRPMPSSLPIIFLGSTDAMDSWIFSVSCLLRRKGPASSINRIPVHYTGETGEFTRVAT